MILVNVLVHHDLSDQTIQRFGIQFFNVRVLTDQVDPLSGIVALHSRTGQLFFFIRQPLLQFLLLVLRILHEHLEIVFAQGAHHTNNGAAR